MIEVNYGDKFVVLSKKGISHYVKCGDAFSIKDLSDLVGNVKFDAVITDPPFDLLDVSWFDNIELVCNSNSCMIFVICNKRIARELIFKKYKYFRDFIVFEVLLMRGAVGSCTNRTISKFNFVLVFNIGKYRFYFKRDFFMDFYKLHDIPALSSDDVLLDKFLLPIERRFFKYKKSKELIKYIVSHYCKEGDKVLDFFGGSGTTLYVADDLGMICYMMEKDVNNCKLMLTDFEKNGFIVNKI